MGVKPDRWIRQMAKTCGLIAPFSECVEGDGIVSYGLQPTGYDARLDPNVLVVDWARACGTVLDPLCHHPELYVAQVADPFYVIPPNSFVLGKTIERFRIPRNCAVRGAAKTGYTNIGINFDVASIHAGWEGHLKLHIANTANAPAKIYGNMGIVYLEFSEIDGEVERDYSERKCPRFQDRR